MFSGKALVHGCGILLLILAGQSIAANALDERLEAPGPLAADAAGWERVQGLIRRAEGRGRVPVILRLNTGFLPEGEHRAPDEVAHQRARIAELQQQVLDRVGGADLERVKRFETIPFMAMAAGPQALAALAADPWVAEVTEEFPKRPLLEESIPIIEGEQARIHGYDGSGWAVAILDTGVDKLHPFLASSVVSEACYSSNISFQPSYSVCPGGVEESTATGSGIPCTFGGCNHGTHVAGIAAGWDSSGFHGVAPSAYIIAVQVFSKFTSTDDCGDSAPCPRAWPSDYIAGLERVYALRGVYNIAAVNMSLGGDRFDAYCDSTEAATKAAIDNLRSAGIATVIASGNDGFTDAVGSPACISTAVTVGNTMKDDQLNPGSNSDEIVDLLAPGTDIYSSIPNSSYGYMTGTSMATPHVVGCFALAKQAQPTATATQIENALKATGTPILDDRNDITRPRVNCYHGLLYAKGIYEDAYEPNDDLASAYDLSAREGSWLNTLLGYGVQIDDDWYRITVTRDYQRLQVNLTFTHAEGDIDLALFDTFGNRLAVSQSVDNDEFIDYTVAAAGTYYLRVYYGNRGNSYNLWWDDLYSGVADDAYEPNDSRETAYNLSTREGVWLHSLSGYGVQTDDDWYRIDVTPGFQQLQAEIKFHHADGDIDLALYDAAGAYVWGSYGTGDSETIDRTLAQGGTYYVKVLFGNQGNGYDLRWQDLASAVNRCEPGDLTIQNLAYFSGVTNIVSQAGISTSSGVSVFDGATLNLTAGTRVSLEPGFLVKPGGVLRASIGVETCP